MYLQFPVAARLPYIPSSPDYAMRKARQFSKQFPQISPGKAREAVARAMGFKNFYALEEVWKALDSVEKITEDSLDTLDIFEPHELETTLKAVGRGACATDDVLSAQELITRHNWQVNAVAQYLELNWRDVEAFMPTWNLTGPSRGGVSRDNVYANRKARQLPMHLSTGLVQKQAQEFVRELGAGDWTQVRPADTGVLAQKWLELVSAGPLSLTRVHEQCLQHESWCASYVRFLENVLKVATPQSRSEVTRETFVLVIRGEHLEIGHHLTLTSEDKAAILHLLEARFGVEGAVVSPVAVVSTAGGTCWDEAAVLDACASLKGASVEVPVHTAPLDDENEGDSNSALLVFFSVADDWIWQAQDMVRMGANEVAADLKPLKAFIPLHGASIALLNPVEALTRTGFTYRGGDNMLATFFDVPAIEAVTISVTWAHSPGAWVPEFMIECTARKRDGTVMSGKLTGMMPVLYVNRVRSSCVKWMASLQVKYRKTRDHLHWQDI